MLGRFMSGSGGLFAASSLAACLGCVEPAGSVQPGAPGAPGGASDARERASVASPEPAATQPQGPAYPFDLCSRAGSHPGEIYETMVAIAGDYDGRRRSDCLTAGLTPVLGNAESVRWHDYLTQYTNGLAGCPLSRPLEGGVRAFGPANTGAAGIPRAAFGRDDASRLIEHYLGAFAVGLSLQGAEIEAVSDFLWASAERELDRQTSRRLAACPEDAGPSDAGPPPASADSGVTDGGP